MVAASRVNNPGGVFVETVVTVLTQRPGLTAPGRPPNSRLHPLLGPHALPSQILRLSGPAAPADLTPAGPVAPYPTALAITAVRPHGAILVPGSGAHLRGVGDHLTAPATTSGDASASTEAAVEHEQIPRRGERALTTPRSRAHAGCGGLATDTLPAAFSCARRPNRAWPRPPPRPSREGHALAVGAATSRSVGAARPPQVGTGWDTTPPPHRSPSFVVTGFSVSSSGHMHCTPGARGGYP